MSAATSRSRPPARPTPDLARFEPLDPQARLRIEELVKRGARIVQVRFDAVVLRRARQVATVDQVGRVRWAT